MPYGMIFSVNTGNPFFNQGKHNGIKQICGLFRNLKQKIRPHFICVCNVISMFIEVHASEVVLDSVPYYF